MTWHIKKKDNGADNNDAPPLLYENKDNDEDKERYKEKDKDKDEDDIGADNYDAPPLSYKDNEKDKDKDKDKYKVEDDNGADNYDATPLSAFATLCKFRNHKSDDDDNYDDRGDGEIFGMLILKCGANSES